MSTSGGRDRSDEKTLWQTDSAFRKTLEALENEVYTLLDEWTVYKQLYASDQERIDLLNELTPQFFGLLQSTLRDSVVAQICRLTEKPKVMGHETLVIRRLCILAEPKYQAIADELEKDSDLIIGLCEAIRDWRDNRVSHLNLAAHLDAANNPPKDFSVKTVQDAIDAIEAFLNKARLKLAGGEFHYDSVYRDGAVRSLLTRMIQAYQYFDFEKQDPLKYDTLLREGKYGKLYTELEDGEGTEKGEPGLL